MTIESELGISLKLLVAGFAGGLVNAVTFKADWRTATAAMITGAFVANYLGPMASKFIDMPEPVGGFICGMAALVVVNGVVGAVRARFVSKEVG